MKESQRERKARDDGIRETTKGAAPDSVIGESDSGIHLSRPQGDTSPLGGARVPAVAGSRRRRSSAYQLRHICSCNCLSFYKWFNPQNHIKKIFKTRRNQWFLELIMGRIIFQMNHRQFQDNSNTKNLSCSHLQVVSSFVEVQILFFHHVT